MSAHSLSRALISAALVALATGCAEDPIAPKGPSPTGTITVNAATTWAYVRFEGDSARVESVATPTTSDRWHIALFGTSVMLNGGAAGPGGVTGFCVCQNEGAGDDAIMAMTAAAELPDFEGVLAPQIPAEESFEADVLVPVISGWFSGSGAAAAARADSTWLIAKGSGASRVVGKFHVTQISGATAAAPGAVTFEYVLQSSPGAAFGATQTATVTVGATPVYFDFATGAVSSVSAWDVQFDGFTIRLNSGVSGSGTVRGLNAGANSFASIDATFAASVPAVAFRSDAFGGVFVRKLWYRYNLTGSDNQIWPTFNVYLIAVGDAVYKVQIISYYDTAGAARQITLRYSRLR